MPHDGPVWGGGGALPTRVRPPCAGGERGGDVLRGGHVGHGAFVAGRQRAAPPQPLHRRRGPAAEVRRAPRGPRHRPHGPPSAAGARRSVPRGLVSRGSGGGRSAPATARGGVGQGGGGSGACPVASSCPISCDRTVPLVLWATDAPAVSVGAFVPVAARADVPWPSVASGEVRDPVRG